MAKTKIALFDSIGVPKDEQKKAMALWVSQQTPPITIQHTMYTTVTEVDGREVDRLVVIYEN